MCASGGGIVRMEIRFEKFDHMALGGLCEGILTLKVNNQRGIYKVAPEGITQLDCSPALTCQLAK